MSRTRRRNDAEQVYGTDWDAIGRPRAEARRLAKLQSRADVYNTDWDQVERRRDMPDDRNWIEKRFGVIDV